MIIPFATQSYRHDSLPISAQRALNLYAERQPPDAKTQVSVHGSPGITTFATCGAGPIRGLHVFNSILYAVSGSSLYSISNAATPVATQVGVGIGGSGVVDMADNGSLYELMTVNGANGYVYDATSGFRVVTDADFFAANTVAYLDGFFLFDRANSDQFFRSDLLDGSSYDSTAFASKEAKSDSVQAVVNVKEILHVLGVKSSELWANAGAANFPFQRLPGGTIDRGIISPHANAQEDQGLFLVGDDRIAYRFAGTQPARISTHAIESTWGKYSAVSDCFGLAYTWNGHKFIVFTYPTQQVPLGDTSSWAYDISTGFWHEKLSYDLNGNPLGRWRGNCAIEAYGRVLIGDAFSGKIGYMDPTAKTEFDCPMYAQAVSPPYPANGKWLFTSSFELDMETGVGITPAAEVGIEGNDAYTKALLHFSGADASTTITDSNAGGSAHAWTAAGNAQIDTAQSKFGGASGLFDGTGDWVTTPDHADFTLGSGDWTIDFWFFCDAAGGTTQWLAGQSDNAITVASVAWGMNREPTNVIRFFVSDGASYFVAFGTTQFTNAVNMGWHHVAGVRAGNILKLFIDGAQEGGDISFSGTVNDSSNDLWIGTLGEFTSDLWIGWIDEFRLSVGIARWTENFTPPEGPYQTVAEVAANAVGVSPQVMLDISDDGGRTFSAEQPWASLGAMGQYKQHIRWNQLGSTEPGGTRVFRITVSDPVKKTILGARGEFTVGM